MDKEDVLSLYVDDIAAVVADLLRAAPGLWRAFAAIAEASGPRLNVRKCVGLPLWPTWADASHRLWRKLAAEWGDFGACAAKGGPGAEVQGTSGCDL